MSLPQETKEEKKKRLSNAAKEWYHNKVANENTEKSDSALEERVNELESTIKKMAQLLSDGLNNAAYGEYPDDVIDALDSIASGEDPDMSSDSDSESPFSEAELRAMRD